MTGGAILPRFAVNAFSGMLLHRAFAASGQCMAVQGACLLLLEQTLLDTLASDPCHQSILGGSFTVWLVCMLSCLVVLALV